MKKSNHIFWMVSLTLLLISLLIYCSMQQNVKEGLGISVGKFIDDFASIAATMKKVTQAVIEHERKMMKQYRKKKDDYNNFMN
jgi:hypothetical protein